MIDITNTATGRFAYITSRTDTAPLLKYRCLPRRDGEMA